MPDTLKAITFDQAKAKLNLAEASLYEGWAVYGDDYGNHDFDRAAGRILPYAEMRRYLRISA